MRADQASTRVTALAYDADAMRARTVLLPFLLLLADGVACKDDEPTGNEFGEPCGYDLETDKEMTCADGLTCYVGYCEEVCMSDADCQSIDGYSHRCEAGICHIQCNEMTLSCPQSLATPLECGVSWCKSAA